MSKKVRQISITQARERLEAGDCTFLDIRDPGSFDRGHIPGAVPITDGNVERFMEKTDRERTLIVYCYHGNSSLAAARYFLEHGFQDVFSMAGGFEEWRWNNPMAKGAS